MWSRANLHLNWFHVVVRTAWTFSFMMWPSFFFFYVYDWQKLAEFELWKMVSDYSEEPCMEFIGDAKGQAVSRSRLHKASWSGNRWRPWEEAVKDGMKEREGRVGECILSSDLVGKWKVGVISLSDAAANRWELRKYPHSNYIWLYRTFCVFHVMDVMTKSDTC